MVLQLSYTGFGVEAEDAAAETQISENQYTELSFSSYGIDDDTYNNTETYGSVNNLANMDKVAFSGKIKFGGNGGNSDAYVRIGGWNESRLKFALGIFYNSDTICLFDHLDGGLIELKRVAASDLEVNPLETAVDIRLTFDYEESTNVRIKFYVEGKEYYNGVLTDAVSKIGTYMVVSSTALPITVESTDFMADHGVLTFSNLGYEENVTVENGEMSKSLADGNLDGVAIEGYYKFTKATDNYVFIGGAKQGIRLCPTASGNMYVHYYNPSSSPTELGAIYASAAGTLTGIDVKIKVGFMFSNVNTSTNTGNVKVIVRISDFYQREYHVTNVSLASFVKTVRIVSGSTSSPLTITSIVKPPMEGYTVKTFTDFGFEEEITVSKVSEKISKSIEGSTLHQVAIEGYYNFYAHNTAQFVYMGADEYGLRIESATNGNIIARYRFSSTDSMRDLATFTPTDLGITLTGTDVKIKTGFEFLNVSEDGTTGDVKVTMLFEDTIKREFTIAGANLSLFHQTITIKTLIDQQLKVKAVVSDVEYDKLSFTGLGYDLCTTVTNSEAYKTLEGQTLDRVMLEGYYSFSAVEGANLVLIGDLRRGIRIASTQNGNITIHQRDDEAKEWITVDTVMASEDLILTGNDIKMNMGFSFSAVDETANTGTVKFVITISDTYTSTHYLTNVSLDAFMQTVRIVSSDATAPLTIKDIATDGKEIQKVTFSDYGIKDGTYNGKGSWLYKKGALLDFENLNCVEFSGKVIFGHDGSNPHHESVRIGGLTSSTPWKGIGVMYSNYGIYLRNYLDDQDKGEVLKHVPTYQLTVNPLETAVEIKILFVYVNDKQDVRLIFSIDGVEFYNDIIEGAAGKLGPYMVVSSHYTPMTVGSVSTGVEQEEVDVEYYNLANTSVADGYGYLLVGKGDILLNNESTTNGRILNSPGDYDVRVIGEGEYVKKIVLYSSGDAHPDGILDARDLVAAKKALCDAQLETEAGVEGADVDRDGIVDDADYDSVCNHLIGENVITGAKDSYLTYEKDVMPIAGYFGPYRVRDNEGNIMYDYLTDDIYSKIQALGINLINRTQNNYLTSEEEKKDIFDGLALAEEKGIGVYVSDARIGVGNQGTLAEYAEYSSFKGLFMVDEPDILELYGRSKNTINLAGYSTQTAHLNSYSNISGYINLHPMNQACALETEDLATDYDAYLEQYISACNPKVLSWDYYVFDEKNIVKDTYATVEGYFTNLSVMREKSMKYNIPFWSYVQAGTYWNNNGDGSALPYKEINTPTKQQLLWNVNTALAYGAKGITYFPLIQPHYFATDDSTDDSMDYTRNGLIGANGEPTQWYSYAQAANEQIREVDEVLLYATSKAVLAVGTTARDKTGITLSSYGDLEAVTADTGAIVGVFDYQGKTAYYVVNYDTAGTSTTGISSTVTLNFNSDKKQTFQVVSKQLASAITTTDTSCALELVSGGAALVIVE